MKNFLLLKSGRALVVAFAAIAPVVAGQVSAAPDNASTKGVSSSSSRDSGVVESGTIPQARPGLPQLSRGAEGPIRSDMRVSSDPSIRDKNPLTVNGLWETLPGGRVATPPTQ